MPSGLFPAVARPVGGRPTYREPHPVRAPAVATGTVVGVLWMLLFGLLGRDLTGSARWSLLAGAVAWLTALVLARAGDRGVAVGVATAVGAGWSVTTVAVMLRWIGSADWPLW